jgi:hypothetical protein
MAEATAMAERLHRTVGAFRHWLEAIAESTIGDGEVVVAVDLCRRTVPDRLIE